MFCDVVPLSPAFKPFSTGSSARHPVLYPLALLHCISPNGSTVSSSFILGCVDHQPPVNNVSRNIWVYHFMWDVCFYFSKARNAKLYGNSVFSILIHCQTIFQSGCPLLCKQGLFMDLVFLRSLSEFICLCHDCHFNSYGAVSQCPWVSQRTALNDQMEFLMHSSEFKNKTK